ncbi:hypothetical protein Syun_012641 [Stephania yunnanensis]|uniref:Kinesin motor domain-containing protein n=1 Tax=Stephania yunnanensis TaxID=152371 RepID=A0AAP0JZU1_9MAGN
MQNGISYRTVGETGKLILLDLAGSEKIEKLELKEKFLKKQKPSTSPFLFLTALLSCVLTRFLCYILCYIAGSVRRWSDLFLRAIYKLSIWFRTARKEPCEYALSLVVVLRWRIRSASKLRYSVVSFLVGYDRRGVVEKEMKIRKCDSQCSESSAL